MVATAKIPVTSYFVVFMSLESDTYTVPKSDSSFSPFESRCNIQLLFKEDTFGDDSGALEFKVLNFCSILYSL